MSEHPSTNPSADPPVTPFAGLDLGAMLQQAQAMQEQVLTAQRELAEKEVDGTVADGLVTVTVNGTGELLRVKIRADSFDPANTEDLEDLIVAAYRNARARSDALAQEALEPMTGALGSLAGDLGLPGLPGDEGSPGRPPGF